MFSPQCTPSALISDIWGPKERGAALAVFTVAPFAGPGIGPIVGGYLYQAGVSWRWAFWIIAIFVSPFRVPHIKFPICFQAGVCLLQIILTVPETFE